MIPGRHCPLNSLNWYFASSIMPLARRPSSDDTDTMRLSRNSRRSRVSSSFGLRSFTSARKTLPAVVTLKSGVLVRVSGIFSTAKDSKSHRDTKRASDLFDDTT